MKLADELLLTEDGWRRLREELLQLQEEHRIKLGAYLEARRAGEYDGTSAHYQPNDVVLLNQRIAELEAVLSRAIVVGEADREPGKAGVGSWVAVRWEDGGEDSFVVVGPLEVDLGAGRISYGSPVGKALLGRSKGESVEVATPGGPQRLEVLAVR